jgi:hypothetical protein
VVGITIRKRQSYSFPMGMNTMQPDIRNLLCIAGALNIDAGRLLNQKHLNNEGNRYYPTDKTW